MMSRGALPSGVPRVQALLGAGHLLLQLQPQRLGKLGLLPGAYTRSLFSSI
jgi:hypothetical protein